MPVCLSPSLLPSAPPPPPPPSSSPSLSSAPTSISSLTYRNTKLSTLFSFYLPELAHSQSGSVGAFDMKHIQQHWFPVPTPDAQARSTAADSTEEIPTTSKWTAKELLSCNIRYFDVGQDWQVYLCPPVPLTLDASTLDECAIPSPMFTYGIYPEPSITDLSVNFIPQGVHEDKPTYGYLVKDYGDAVADLFVSDATNRAVDGLARVLIKASIPSRKEVHIQSQSRGLYTIVRDLPPVPRTLTHATHYPVTIVNVRLGWQPSKNLP